MKGLDRRWLSWGRVQTTPDNKISIQHFTQHWLDRIRSQCHENINWSAFQCMPSLLSLVKFLTCNTSSPKLNQSVAENLLVFGIECTWKRHFHKVHKCFDSLWQGCDIHLDCQDKGPRFIASQCLYWRMAALLSLAYLLCITQSACSWCLVLQYGKGLSVLCRVLHSFLLSHQHVRRCMKNKYSCAGTWHTAPIQVFTW